MASYSDILFGKIVVRNGLAPIATVQECFQIQEASRGRGVVMSLPEILVARTAITEEQAKLVSRAQALTQLQRAESIYARIVHERGLVSVEVLQQCFAEQRERRFTVRLGRILMERGLLTREQNAELTEEQISRLGDETRAQEELGFAVAAPPPQPRDERAAEAGERTIPFDRVLPIAPEGSRAPMPSGAEAGERTMPFDRVLPIGPGGSQAPSRPDPEAGERTIPFDRVIPIAPSAVDPAKRTKPFDRVLPIGQLGPGGPADRAETTLPFAQVLPIPRPASPPQAARKDGDRKVTIELDVSHTLPGMTPAAVPVDEIDSWGGAPPPEPARAAPHGGSPLIGKTISSRYRILEQVGEGGMGTVYKAEHCLMEKIIAFKVLHPHLIANQRSLERFRKEVRAASKFQHKNVVQIYDAGEGEGGIFYMAMEFVDGTGLEKILKKGPLGVDRTLDLLRQILGAVAEAHAKGIVHRDLKSENVMIGRAKDGSEQVKVMDFGIARILEPEAAASGEAQPEGERFAKSMEGFVTGTPQYMSPEQAEGKVVDHRSDLYSLGIILFEMLTGRLPFESETPIGFIGKHIVEEPPTPTAVRPDLAIPPWLESLVMRLLEKSPDARYQSAGEILREVDSNATREPRAPATPVRAGSPSPKDAVPPTRMRPTPDLAPELPREAAKPPREKPPRPDAEAPRAETPPPRSEPAGVPRALVFTLVGAFLVIALGLGVAFVLRTPSDAGVRTALKEADDLRKAGKLVPALACVKTALLLTPDEPRLKALEKELTEKASPEDVRRAEATTLVGEAERARAAGDRPSLERAVSLLERAARLVPDDSEIQGKLRAAEAELKRVS